VTPSCVYSILKFDNVLLADDVDVDSDGMHKDVNIQRIDESDNDHDPPKKLNNSQPTADIDRFFQGIPKLPEAKKGQVICISCKYVNAFSFHSVFLIYLLEMVLVDARRKRRS
jgi:hypothetical protein